MAIEKISGVVVSPALSYGLTLRDTFKAQQLIIGDADDAYIDMLISQASTTVESYCRRVFAREELQDQVRFIRPHATKAPLILSRRPVTAIISVTEDADAALDPSLYEWDHRTGFLYRLDDAGNRAAWQGRKIVVRFIGGYGLPGDAFRDLPYDVESATLRLMKHEWFARSRDPMLKQQSIPSAYEAAYWVGVVGAGPNLTDHIQPEVATLLAEHVDIYV